MAPAASTLEALARRLGVSTSTLVRWESGATRPRKRHARALARELGVSVDELGLEGADQAGGCQGSCQPGGEGEET